MCTPIILFINGFLDDVLTEFMPSIGHYAYHQECGVIFASSGRLGTRQACPVCGESYKDSPAGETPIVSLDYWVWVRPLRGQPQTAPQTAPDAS